MKRLLWLLAALFALGCGSKASMMVLEDRVFDLVTAEDRAILDAPREDVKAAEQRLQDADKAPQRTQEELSKAAKERELASLNAAAAKAREDALTAMLDWQKAVAGTLTLEVDALKAKYQFERARLAAAKGLRPSEDFDVKKFEKQWLSYQETWVDAQIQTNKKKEVVDEATGTYESAKKAYDKAKD